MISGQEPGPIQLILVYLPALVSRTDVLLDQRSEVNARYVTRFPSCHVQFTNKGSVPALGVVLIVTKPTPTTIMFIQY